MKTSLFVVRAALAGVLALSVTGAAEKQLPAVKGIYLDRANHPNMNGMRFDIELEQQDGSRVEVPVTYDFHSGDRIWLRMDMRNSAYVYVLNRTLSGGDKGIEAIRSEDTQHPPAPAQAWRLVFGPEKLSRGTARRAPKTSAMRFDMETGVEKLFVIISPKPLKLESAFASDGLLVMDSGHREAAQQLDQRLADWNGNADVAVPDKQGAKGIYQDNYGYCVERRPNEAFGFEITLNHSR